MTRPGRLGCFATAVALLASTSACRQPDDQRTESADPQAAREGLDPTVVARLDSGNVAFRADDYPAARAHYEAVVELDPESVPGWFGLYMAERALGDTAAARVALERAQRTAPGASLIHPNGGERP